jgi:hypothetical protein
MNYYMEAGCLGDSSRRISSRATDV